ncbi:MULTISPECIES: hypothetical protein [Nocardiaceae]|uniref:Uncharacterized protein n=1 Tax=Rhodococcoides kroppenstedtii TaxID=293050 RepID=A0ABS7NVN6_9NOCA|nr:MULTISPECIES: hypothetical protein [Rhodococcus]MBY6314384.1 hypothetical protein [Rhodococcus kroppenstedtii]MBY6322080.1 hypothetical protein [Rhodococcus kroppenstedtii]MBY6400968.1 hypothetical protein [Rhodococcus kroppenstedtii]
MATGQLRRGTTVGLPVAVAYSVSLVVAGHGWSGIVSSPGAVLLALGFVFFGVFQGIPVGLASALACAGVEKVGLFDRPGRSKHLCRFAGGVVVGAVTAAAMFAYHRVLPDDDQTGLAPLIFVATVGAISAVLRFRVLAGRSAITGSAA